MKSAYTHRRRGIAELVEGRGKAIVVRLSSTLHLSIYMMLLILTNRLVIDTHSSSSSCRREKSGKYHTKCLPRSILGCHIGG